MQRSFRDKRAVESDPVKQAELADGEHESTIEAYARKSQVEMDEGDLHPWERRATVEKQEEYGRTMEAVANAIYGDDKTFDSLMNMVQQEEDPIHGLVKTASMIITEADRNLNIREEIIPHLPMQVFDMLHELAVESGLIEELSDDKVQSGTAATQEIIMKTYGMDVEDFNGLVEGVSEKDLMKLKGVYDGVSGNGVL